MIGSDLAAIDGGKAIRLDLPGSGITPVIPWIALGVYTLIVILTRKSPKLCVRNGSIVAGFLLASALVLYPFWLFERSSVRIAVRKFLPVSTVKAFNHHFDTPTVQFSSSSGGPWLVVPKSKYSDSMRVWVRTQERKIAEQSEDTLGTASDVR